MYKFHYAVMPSGFKNARAIYQRAIIAIFHDMLHDCLEGYIDDLMVKYKEVNEVKFKEINDRVNNLREVFKRCKNYKFRTNPLKRIFGASSGNLGSQCTKKELALIQPRKSRPSHGTSHYLQVIEEFCL